MAKGKRILLMFNVNFLKRNMGSAHGVYLPVKILKSLGFDLDLFATSQIDDFSDFDKYNNEEIIDNLYFVDLKKKKDIFTKLEIISNKIKKILDSKPKYSQNSYISLPVLKKFQDIIKNNHYDFIYVHYIYWVDLFRYSKIPAVTRLIYNMHDVSFIQHLYNNGVEGLGE